MASTRAEPLRTSGHGTKRELRRSTKTPRVPADLGDTGKRVWRFVWKQAPVEPSDALAVERYCRLHDHRSQLLEVLDDQGLLSFGSTGQRVIHPAMKALATIEQQLGLLETKLALHPEARARLNVAEDGEDAFDKFLRETTAGG